MTADMNKKAMTPEHLAVYEIIANHSDKYITRKLILAKLGHTSDSYGRKLSEIIYDLVVKYGYPVGSSSVPEHQGYFIIRDSNDLRIAKRDLKSRSFSINKRVAALEKIKIQGDK